MSARYTRRGFLVSLGVVAAAAVGGARPWRAVVAVQAPTDADRLVGVLPRVDSARVVGAAYLQAFPREATVPGLVEGIAARLPGGRDAVRRSSAAALRTAVLETIRDDFAREHVVTVGGWILSGTEARLYALASLV